MTDWEKFFDNFSKSFPTDKISRVLPYMPKLPQNKFLRQMSFLSGEAKTMSSTIKELKESIEARKQARYDDKRKRRMGELRSRTQQAEMYQKQAELLAIEQEKMLNEKELNIENMTEFFSEREEQMARQMAYNAQAANEQPSINPLYLAAGAVLLVAVVK